MPSLLRQTLSALRDLKIYPSKKLGQNFLVDANVIGSLVGLAQLNGGDCVVEIGPGLGAISEKILLSGARLFAVEIDGKLVGFLIKKFQNYAKFEVQCGDAVRLPIAGLPDNIKNFKIISNLPYSVSSPWVDALLGCGRLPEKMAIIVQKECALRFLAKEKLSEICPISIFLQSAYELVAAEKISDAAFFPKPAVSSMLLCLKRKDNAFVFHPTTKHVIRKIFTMRRKQIFGIIKNESTELVEWLQSSGMPQNLRPEEIPIAQWQQLDSFFSKKEHYGR